MDKTVNYKKFRKKEMKQCEMLAKFVCRNVIYRGTVFETRTIEVTKGQWPWLNIKSRPFRMRLGGSLEFY